MSAKTRVWLGMILGSTVGGFLPMLWGGDLLSFSGIILSGLGAIAGIIIFFKLGE